MLARLLEVSAVALLLEPRQQRLDRFPHVAHHAHVDRRAAPDHFAALVDLRDAHAAAARIELPIGKIRSKHEQHVAIDHGVVARGKPDQPGHADVIRVVPLDVFLAFEGVDDRSFQALGERDELRVGALAPRAA